MAQMITGKLDSDFKRAAFAALTGVQLPTSGNASISCPMPDHDDASPSCSVAADTRFKCHGCGVRGDVFHVAAARWGLDVRRDFRALVRRLERAVPSVSDADETATETEQTTTNTRTGASTERGTASSAMADPRDALQAHKQIAAARARVLEYVVGRGISPATLARIPHQVLHEPRLGLRVFVDIGKGQRASMTRFIDEESDKHKASSGLPLVPMLRDGDTSLLVVTEGLFDLMTASELGFSAVSLPNGAASVAKVATELAAVARRYQQVVIATDRDEKGERAAAQIVTALEHVGITSTRRMIFPVDGAAKDLNAIYLAEDAITSRACITEAEPYFSDVAPASWIERDWVTREDPPREFIVEGLFARGERGFVAGAGESLKSMLLRAIVVAAVQDEGVVTPVGHLRVRGGLRVAWLNEELPPADFRRQLLRVARGMGATDEALARIHPASETGFTLGDKRSMTRLGRLLAVPGPPWMVVIDSLRQVLGGTDENVGTAVAGVLRALRGVLASVNASVLIIAHGPKNETRAKSKIAGSTATYDWAELVIDVERKKKNGPATLRRGKGRNVAGDDDVLGDFDVVDGPDGALVPTAGEGPKGTVSRGGRERARTLTSLARKVGAALEKLPGRSSRNAIRKTLGVQVAYAKLGAALEELVSAGVAETDARSPTPMFWVASPPDLRGASDPTVAA